MPTLSEVATYQPPLPAEEFTELVTYWAKAANPEAYGGMETTHHAMKETDIDTVPDPHLQRALRIQLYLNRSEGMFALPVCDEQHVLSHTVYVQRERRFGPVPEDASQENLVPDDVLPIFAEPSRRTRLLGWLGKKVL